MHFTRRLPAAAEAGASLINSPPHFFIANIVLKAWTTVSTQLPNHHLLRVSTLFWMERRAVQSTALAHSSLPLEQKATAPSASPLESHKNHSASILPASISPDIVLQRISLLAYIPNEITWTSADQRQIIKEIAKPVYAFTLRWSGGRSAGLCLLHPSKVQPSDTNSLENKNNIFCSSSSILMTSATSGKQQMCSE